MLNFAARCSQFLVMQNCSVHDILHFYAVIAQVQSFQVSRTIPRPLLVAMLARFVKTTLVSCIYSYY